MLSKRRFIRTKNRV